MRIVFAGVLAALLAGTVADALAELYRWRDPQTGRIKYSSYPPPWYGDETREATAPKVEVIGDRPSAGSASQKATDEMTEKVAEVIRFMEQRRQQLLSRMTVAHASAGFDPADPAFTADLQAYRAVTRELDKFDPKGAAVRRTADARAFANLGVEPQAGEGAGTAGESGPAREERARGVTPAARTPPRGSEAPPPPLANPARQ